MKGSVILISIFICLLFGCKAKKKEEVTTSFDLKKLEWLLGTWKGETEGQTFYENWAKTSDTKFTNTNFYIIAKDTTFTDRSAIEVINNKIFFTSDNDIWALVSETDNECIFENKLKGEVYTFTHTENDHWKALFNYPSNQIKYDMTRIPPVKVPPPQ